MSLAVRSGRSTRAKPSEWIFCLYVAGQGPRAGVAVENLTKFCETYLAGHYRIEVVDLLVHPHLATENNIVAVPTLVRISPGPVRRVIGALSDSERMHAILVSGVKA